MSYTDSYSDYEDIYYHNYSVDYANQILNGQFNISSQLPYKIRRSQPKLLRVSTLDHMPIINNRFNTSIPQLHSNPKFEQQEQSSSPVRPLPSLEQTSQELQRRATRSSQPNVTPLPTTTTTDQYQPMTEDQLRQVQQQQQAFQQHLINMQNHLLQQPTSPPSQSRTNRFEKKTKKIYHSFECDDDQDEIAQLIESDPYFAAAMQDFALTHRLIKQRSDSDCSRDSSPDLHHHHYHSTDSSSSSSSTTTTSSSSSLTNVTPQRKTSTNNSMLYRELHEIRVLIQDYITNRTNFGGYPSGGGFDDHRIQINPPRKNPPLEPNRILYQNVVNVVKEVMERRSPSQQDQPLKPSQIHPSLKQNYTKRSNLINLPTQINGRRTSSPSSAPSLQNNIPPPPPYENLATFRSSRPQINANGHLSYGTYPKQYFFSKSYF